METSRAAHDRLATKSRFDHRSFFVRAKKSCSSAAHQLKDAMRKAPPQLYQARVQIFFLLRNAKWIIVFSLLLAVILFIPDQTKELYRIAYSDSIAAATFGKKLQVLFLDIILKLHVSVILIGTIVWYGARQIASETQADIKEPKPGFFTFARLLPPALGAIPLLAFCLGLYAAIPSPVLGQNIPPLTGGPWEEYGRVLIRIYYGLLLGLVLQAVVSLALAVAWWKRSGSTHSPNQGLRRYWNGHWSGFRLALAVTLTISAAFLWSPVALPQAIGAVSVLTAFALCVTLFVVNLTLVGMRLKVPTISVLVLAAFAFSALDLNDNHWVRTIDMRVASSVLPAPAPSPSEAKAAGKGQSVDLELSPGLPQQAITGPHAVDEFEAWLKQQRETTRNPDGEFPVYIVSAQGGGLYAAYQTAMFLARMQDHCKTFRNHVFAISSVSGGSIGAAVFAAALRAHDQGTLEQADLAKASGSGPCPDLDRFFRATQLPTDLERPGPLETAVDNALKGDFLSPLIAAALFPDFTQRFLPFRVPFFDRARALEYTLESAGRTFLNKANRSKPEANPLESSVLSLWQTRGSIPALLLNATDAASGRRFVIAPFALAPKSGVSKLGPFIQYQFWPPPKSALTPQVPSRCGKPKELGTVRDLRLSTAAVISARFPWATPAATVPDSHFQHDCIDRVRLIDGGYVDNSGLETALDLRNTLLPQLVGTNVKLHVIVLSGGDFPVRHSFALGETMEPLRGLLSTRTARAFVAMDRADQSLSQIRPETDGRLVPPALKKVMLSDRFYGLPLGWLLSEETRSIIGDQSGRYWECVANKEFLQAQASLATADCVQTLIYHELSGTTNEYAERIAAFSKFTQQARGAPDDSDIRMMQRLEYMIACYRDAFAKSKKLEKYHLIFDQTNALRALYGFWGGHTDDPKPLLPYMLATAAFESGEFRNRIQSFYFTSVDRILAFWKFADIPPEKRIEELQQYIRKPELLADRLYGGTRGNIKGTKDAWNYRGRGMAMLTFKENYERYGKAIGVGDELVKSPDLIFRPDVNAKVFFEAYFRNNLLKDIGTALASGDRRTARGLVLKSAGRTSVSDEHVREIEERQKMFETCIAEADQIFQR